MNLTKLPREFALGDTVEWTETDAEYPAPTWSVKYYFTGLADNFATEDSIANGSDHDLSINTAVANIAADGVYRYQRKVTDGSDTFTTEQGQVTVLPDLADDTGGVDRRRFAEIALANLEAVIQGKATKDQTSYSLNGRALSRYSPDELNEWRSLLRAEIRDLRASDRRKRGGKSHQNVRLRFNSGNP